MTTLDAAVVGAGPNGLAAALELARAGYSVEIFEAADQPGGAARSVELIESGFVHDIGATALPLARMSPFLRSLPLEVSWAEPGIEVGHPIMNDAVVAERSIGATAARLAGDGPPYRALLERLAGAWSSIEQVALGPLLRWPARPITAAAFGLLSIESAQSFSERTFSTEQTRALMAGNAAHAIVPLNRPGTNGFALLLLSIAHIGGWPFVAGGTGRLVDAMVRHFEDLGGRLHLGSPIGSIFDLPTTRAILLDTSPGNASRLLGEQLPARMRRRLQGWRHGPGAFKVDWTLDEPIPWKNPLLREAGTIHVGGTFGEIAASELAVWKGSHPERPFVLLTQPTVADPTRAPHGKHTAWAYCHVPNGSDVDMTDAIEAQIERFAPGFRDVIRGRHSIRSSDLERWSANLVGGDVGGGANTIKQLLMRPTIRPYRLGRTDAYLCSASTPPGGGFHGMSGYHAARAAMRNSLR